MSSGEPLATGKNPFKSRANTVASQDLGQLELDWSARPARLPSLALVQVDNNGMLP